jgi:3-hydroxyisobutyrate dehydrogenase
VTEAPPATQVAFVGLGNMGTPMSEHLLAAGFRVRGYDTDADARARLAVTGGTAADSLADAVNGASVVILMLPDSGVVELVMGDPALIDALGDETIVVDMSSSEPLRTKALAAKLAERGIVLIDAPVSGGVARARTGTLTIMAGGEQRQVDRVAAVLRPLGEVTRVGDVGSGHALKALNNLLSATHLLATAAAVLTGERFGLDPQVMLSVINASSGQSASSLNKFPKFILSETYDSGFGLRLMLKDMRIAVGLAEQLGCPDALGADVVGLWAQAAESLPPQADHTEIARWVRARLDTA